MKKISFYSSTNLSFSQSDSLRLWMEKLLSLEGVFLKKLSFNAVDAKTLLNLNKNYLSHNYKTDVLAFNYSVGRNIEGDVFFSVDDVKKNASAFSASFEDELLRVMAHGVLHLIGYGDISVADKSLIRKKEDYYIALYFNLFHVKPFKNA